MNALNVTQTCLFSVLLFSSIVENVQGNGRLYSNLKGNRMSDPYDSHIIDGVNGRISCALYCLYKSTDKDCRTVGYSAITGLCELHINPIDDGEVDSDHDWELLYDIRKDDWEVLMRIKAGSGVSPSAVWFGEVSLSQEPLCNLPGNVECDVNFRSETIDNWKNINKSIKQVKIEFFTNLQRVMFMTFNGTGSNSSSWFHKDRYLDSSWYNFPDTSAFGHFSINSKYPHVGRTFDVSDNQNACSSHSGWLVVMDGILHSTAATGGVCIWEKTYTDPTPTFLYSPLQYSSVVWKGVHTASGTADTMVISFKRN